MEDPTREYSGKEIVALAKAIRKEEESFHWLMQNDCKELAALCEVLVYGQDDAAAWLKKNGFNTLLAFIDALDENDKAFKFLLKGSHKEWAAVINAVNDDDGARAWLVKFNMKHFLLLVDTLAARAEEGGSGGGFGGGSGGGGGSGFGGFGGGGFGGGGAGGRW
jgi:uncharacterized membrane protein YgcG